MSVQRNLHSAGRSGQKRKQIADIISFMTPSIEFLAEALFHGENVLIFCMAGVRASLTKK